MQTETYLKSQTILIRMGENERYANEIESATKGSPVFDEFIKNVADTVRFLDTFNPTTSKPLKPLMDKINTLLTKYSHIDYETLIRTVHAEDFCENDYSQISATLKKKLFRYRAKIYLSALADTVEKGYKLEDILDSVKIGIIPHIKKEVEEPSFNEIYLLLKPNP